MKKVLVSVLLVSLFSSVCYAECEETKKGKKYHKVCEEGGVVVSEEINDGKIHTKREWENGNLTYEGIWDIKKSVGTVKKFLAGELTESLVCYGQGQSCYYDGPQREFRSNGQIASERFYKDSKKDGVWKYWYENGQLKREEEYKNGILGAVRKWYEDGRPMAEHTYKDGKIDATWKEWDEDGGRTESEYKDGRYIVSHWDKFGQLLSECPYKKKDDEYYVLDGRSREWYDNGQLAFEQFYKDSQEDGVWKMWYKNGQIASECITVRYKVKGSRKKGGPREHFEITRECKQWDEKGTLRYEQMYDEKKKRMITKKRFSDGKPAAEYSYTIGNRGRRDGTFRLWHEKSGEQMCETNYSDGLKDGVQKEWSAAHRSYKPDGDNELITELHYKIMNGESVLSGEQKWVDGLERCSGVFQSGKMFKGNCTWRGYEIRCEQSSRFDVWEFDNRGVDYRCERDLTPPSERRG